MNAKNAPDHWLPIDHDAFLSIINKVKANGALSGSGPRVLFTMYLTYPPHYEASQ